MRKSLDGRKVFRYIYKFVGFIFSCPYFVVLKDSVEDALKVTVSIFLKFDDKAER